jgi:uncharacterized repeat protein (TIGR02543 family)
MRSRFFIPAALWLAFFQAAFAQIQLIQDGGFESPIYSPPWFLAGSGITIASGTNANGGFPYDGAEYLSMGNFSGAVQYAYQTITFPTNLIGATLSLYYQTVSTDPNGDDFLYFEIRDTNNDVLIPLAYLQSAYPTPNSAYVNYTTNFITYAGSDTLSSYAGQTVELYFYLTTDSTYGSLTSFDIDDVSLLAGTLANIPSNDNFTNATVIPADDITVDVNTVYASKEPGEPYHAGNAGGHSVWWTWTAPAIGTVAINTSGSGFNTLLAVYTNSPAVSVAFSNLICVSSNNGASRVSGLASLQFNVSPGTQYYIALDGYNGQAGNAVFNFTFSLDTTPPSVAISFPAAGASVTNSSILVQGTANDNVAVASVQCRLANAAGTNAWQLAATTNAWTNWTATLTNLIPGTNTVTVEALDTSGNMSLLSRVFYYDVPTPLALSISGQGVLSISGTSAIANPTNGQLLDLALPYKITAKAAAGFAFTGWTGSIATNAASLSFIMATNLSFTANFVLVQKPTLTLTAPAANQRWSNSLFQIAGKAADLVAVAAVYYQFDGGAWTLASTTNAWTNWTATVTLTPGTNTVRAYAVDTSGIISTNTNSISFVYVVTAPLIVQIHGKGTVNPDYNGQSLQVGQNYSMTATAVPGAGFVFTNWTGSFPTNNAKLTFLMASNLTLIANFVDVTPPGLAITSPTAGQRWSNSTFTVKGTASDNVQVAGVFCQLNGGSWTAATTTNTWTNWTANVTLIPGTNTVRAYAEDTSGNISPTNKVAFLYIPSATLVVQTNGHGTVTPNDDGKLLALGTNYTLTANPGQNYLFSNWVGGVSPPYAVAGTNPVYTFTMQSNLVLQANFVTNIFLAAQGAYNGLFAPTNSPRQQTNSGSFTINVTSSGVLSGNLVLGTNTIPLNGKFDLGGAARILSTPKGGNPLTTALQLNLAGQSVQGTVTDGSFLARLDGDQAVFSPSHKAANYQGQYTLIIPGTNAPAIGPFGASWGTVTVDASGNIVFAGSLADGTNVSRSSVVSKDGYWPFYLPLYNGAGSLWGWNYFTNNAIVSAPFLSWINATNSAKTAVYRSGFTNQQAAVIGSIYTSTAQPLLGLTNAQVTLEGGGLPFGITNQITLASNNKITVPRAAENTNGLTLTITTKTGLISGTFLNPASAKQTITVNGVLLQNQTNAAGFFLGTNQSGAFNLVPQ